LLRTPSSGEESDKSGMAQPRTRKAVEGRGKRSSFVGYEDYLLGSGGVLVSRKKKGKRNGREGPKRKLSTLREE